MIDLNKLEELARAAIPGNWALSKYGSVMDEYKTEIVPSEVANCDKRFIAAANPATMLDLIALIRKQEAELASARAESANSGTSAGFATGKESLQTAPSATIDGPKFSDLLAAWGNADEGDDALAAADALIAHIDAHVSQEVARAAEVSHDALRNIRDYRTDVSAEIAARSMRFYAEIALSDQPAAQPGDGELPPLPTPSPTHYRERGMLLERMEMFTADQMRDYGRLCLAARQPVPVDDALPPCDGLLAHRDGTITTMRAFLASSMESWGNARYQQGRDAGIEEAAKVCETQIDPTRPATTSGYAIWHASAIRALKKTGGA